MTGFLASIKNIEEAELIISENIDIIDFKKVNDGALGYVGKRIINQGVKLLRDHVMSVTMGNDINPNNKNNIENINYVIKSEIDYLKIGLFDIKMIDQHQRLLKKINFLKTKPICVIFADQSFDLSLVQNIIDIGYKGIMIDTCIKNSKSTLDLIDINDIKKFINIVNNNKLICGISGSLKIHHIKELKDLNIDFLGFRGQICSKSSNRNDIDISQVNKVSREIKN
tara:strand:+ start:91 stop:768 length:678 start_codon:yes stop_codon:yes gene_type:complete